MPASTELVKSFHTNLRGLFSLDAPISACRSKVIADKYLELPPGRSELIHRFRTGDLRRQGAPSDFIKPHAHLPDNSVVWGCVMALEKEYAVGFLFVFCAFWCIIYIVLQLAETRLGVAG